MWILIVCEGVSGRDELRVTGIQALVVWAGEHGSNDGGGVEEVWFLW